MLHLHLDEINEPAARESDVVLVLRNCGSSIIPPTSADVMRLDYFYIIPPKGNKTLNVNAALELGVPWYPR